MKFSSDLNSLKSQKESNLIICLLDESDGITKLTSVILGALTVCLVTVVIGLVVKIRKLQTGTFSKLLSLFHPLAFLAKEMLLNKCEHAGKIQ